MNNDTHTHSPLLNIAMAIIANLLNISMAVIANLFIWVESEIIFLTKHPLFDASVKLLGFVIAVISLVNTYQTWSNNREKRKQ